MNRPTLAYGRLLRGQWLLVLVVAVVCVAAAAAYLVSAPKSYSATADLLVTPIAAGDTSFVGIPVLRDSGTVPGTSTLMISRQVLKPETAAIVKKELHDSSPAASLESKIAVSPLSEMNVVSITATDSTPGGAAALANAFARATISRRSDAFQKALVPIVNRLQAESNALRGKTGTTAQLAAVQARLADLKPLVGSPDPTVAVLNGAQAPVAASSRHTSLVLGVALLAGLLLGAVAAIARELVNPRLRHEDDLAAAGAMRVLARVRPRAFHGGVPADRRAAEAFRNLRERLLGAGPSGSILVTSAERRDGTTYTAVNLARSLAAHGRRVVLLDCDFHRPGVARAFGAPVPPDGFGALFLRGQTQKSLVPARPDETLRLALPTLRDAGQLEALDAARIRMALERLQGVADVVVIDAAPLSESPDALLLAAAAGTTLVTARLGRTRQAALEDARGMLAGIAVRPAGLVLLHGPSRPARALAAVAFALRGAYRSFVAAFGVEQPQPSRPSPRSGAAQPAPARAGSGGRQQGRAHTGGGPAIERIEPQSQQPG